MPPFQGGDADSNSAGGTEVHRVPWCSLAKHAALSRRRTPVQIRSGPQGFPASRGAHAQGGSLTIGEVAQLAEHAAENRGVGSSILPLATSSATPGSSRRPTC